MGALLTSRAGPGGRLGVRRRGRGTGLAALGERAPLPVGRAVGSGSWGRVLRNAAALLVVPVPRAGAVVAVRRERGRAPAAVGNADGARTPPPLVVAAVVAAGRVVGALAGPGAVNGVSR